MLVLSVICTRYNRIHCKIKPHPIFILFIYCQNQLRFFFAAKLIMMFASICYCCTVIGMIYTEIGNK